MKKFICISIATLITLPVLCQEEKLQKLENLENNTEIKSDSVNKLLKNRYRKLRQDTVIVEVGDEIFSVKEIGDETRIKIGKKEFRVVENDDGVVVFKSSARDHHIKKQRKIQGTSGRT